MLNQAAVATLNHLLTQSGWALPRLARFSGKTARFHVAPFSFSCTVLSDGSLQAAPTDASADATSSLSPALLPRLALGDEAALEQVATSGDAALIAEIVYLARNLRWDAAEDLSRLIGDVAAERAVQFAQAQLQNARDAALSLSQAAAEYWTEERPLLATPQQVGDFKQQVSALQESLARLEQRIARFTPPA
jgi:ubiquinone biosynthesis protein UbiJ